MANTIPMRRKPAMMRRPRMISSPVRVVLPLTGGPGKTFLATVIRSLLYWDADGAALSLQNFVALFSDPRFYQAVGNTVLCGAGATIISCVLGFSLAWVVSRTDMPGRRWFEILNLVPFFLSPYVGAVSWIYLAAPNSGLLQNLLAPLGIQLGFLNIYSLGGVIWVLSLFYTPYVYLFVIAPMRQMDAALEDAARVHGASFWYTLRHITIPLLMPALLSGALVVFVTSAGLFDVPLALAATEGHPHDADRDLLAGAVSVRPRPRRGVRRGRPHRDHPARRAAAAVSRPAPLRDRHRQGLSAAHHRAAARSAAPRRWRWRSSISAAAWCCR